MKFLVEEKVSEKTHFCQKEKKIEQKTTRSVWKKNVTNKTLARKQAAENALVFFCTHNWEHSGK